MSTRILSFVAALVATAMAAAAQTPPAKDQSAPGMELGGAVRPVMDWKSSRTSSLTSLRAGLTAATLSPAGKDRAGSAPITTNYGSSRRAPCKATARSTTANIGSSTAARSRPISICKAGCARYRFTPDPQLGSVGHSGSRALFFRCRAHRLCEWRGPSRHEARRLVRPPSYPAAHPAAASEGESLQQSRPRPHGRRRLFRHRYRPAPALRIQPQLRAYLGVVYEGKFGQTASFARRAGESAGDVRFVFGIRTWF